MYSECAKSLVINVLTYSVWSPITANTYNIQFWYTDAFPCLFSEYAKPQSFEGSGAAAVTLLGNAIDSPPNAPVAASPKQRT